MIPFAANPGFDTVNTAVQWQNIDTATKPRHALAPTPIAAPLDGAPATVFTTSPASSVRVVLTP